MQVKHQSAVISIKTVSPSLANWLGKLKLLFMFQLIIVLLYTLDNESLLALLSNWTKILINHIEVAKSNNAIIFLKINNQLPGLGINEIITGKKPNKINGNDKPIPIVKRIEKISIAPPESAKPIAVPTRGAVQGVAKKVKNIPVKKSAM